MFETPEWRDPEIPEDFNDPLIWRDCPDCQGEWKKNLGCRVCNGIGKLLTRKGLLECFSRPIVHVETPLLITTGGNMPVDLTFKELRTKNVKRCEEAFPTCKDWTLADWMNATVGKLGELANILKKVKRGDFPMESVAEEVGKEIADVAIYLDLMAAKAGVNLADAIIQKFNEVSDRRNCAIKL